MVMPIEKHVQIKIPQSLYVDAKIGLAKLDLTWQEFLSDYIRLKFAKGCKIEKKSK